MILPLLACLTLVGASSAPFAVSSLPYGNEPVPQCLVVQGDVLTFSQDELNNYTFSNVHTYLSSIGSDSSEFADFSSNVALTYNNFDFTTDEFTSDDLTWVDSTNNTAVLLGVLDDEIFKFYFYTDWDGNVIGSFSSSLNLDLGGVDSTVKTSLITAFEADISANESGMSGVDLVGDIVDILVSGLTSFGTGIGSSISNFASALAFENGALSPYFIIVLAFCAISLCVGITTRLFLWLGSLGRN